MLRATLLVSLLACSTAAPASVREEAVAEATPPDADPGLAPLAGNWIEKLELVGGWVAPPIGATGPRPVIVAAHGAMDEPGGLCAAWRIIADVYPFVVCPSATKVKKDTFVWSSSAQLDATVDAALLALRARYGPYVAEGPAIYVAFSQGANLAGPVLVRKDGTPRFARAVLTEGGYRAFEPATAAKAFGAAGGERVLFTCSQPGCATWFTGSARALDHAGIPVHVLDAGNHGHAIPPEVRMRINEALPWLVDGAPGWEGYGAHPRLASH